MINAENDGVLWMVWMVWMVEDLTKSEWNYMEDSNDFDGEKHIKMTESFQFDSWGIFMQEHGSIMI